MTEGQLDTVFVRSVLNALEADVHETATAKGWHDKPRSLGEEIALMHSELSEALEEVRTDQPLIYYRLPDGRTSDKPYSSVQGSQIPNKTEGVAAEFADVIIRILDTARERRIPVVEAMLAKMEYNKTRSYRHGNKSL